MEEKLRFTRETLAHLDTLKDVAIFATTVLFSAIPTHKIAVAVIEGNRIKSINTLGKRVFLDLNLDQSSINTRAVKTKRTQLVNDTSRDPDYLPGDPNEPMSSELCVPLIHRGKVLGTINFEHQHPGRYTEEDAHVAEAYAKKIAEAVYRVQGIRLSTAELQSVNHVKIRSPMEIHHDLLRVVYGGETVLNKILNRAAIQWKPGKDMVHDLVAKGYLAREKTSANRYAYRITDEGIEAMKTFEDMMEKLR